MTTTTMTSLVPIKGPEYDKARPETRQPWLDFRRPGLTATMIRDWGNGSKRRKILEEKATGEFEDLSGIAAVEHGNRREPIIAEWIRARYGIEPCDNVFAHAENSRHLASPDGVSLDPFTRELVVGTTDAVVAEIKTSKHDLTPGRIVDGWLIDIDQEGYFTHANYYTQMQWQMYVMNAFATLFVWEQHDGTVDPETGTYRPMGPPQVAWVARDEALIAALLTNVAPRALAEIDKALAIRSQELPPASEFPAEDAMHVADVLKARDDIATAEAVRERAWGILDAKYPDDCSHDLGFATLTVSSGEGRPTSSNETYVDRDGMNAREKAQYDRALALIEKHTKTRKVVKPGKPYRKMTLTRKDVK